MNIDKWISKYKSLKGKLVAITGASGDLGKQTCLILASLGADLLLLNRNRQKTLILKEEILNKYPNVKINEIIFDLENFKEVKSVITYINNYSIDILILNAGSYKIPRRISDLGYDNVFQINFISQYYIARKVIESMEKRRSGKIVVVSSIAHNYSKINLNDIDFKRSNKASKVYGNSKRFLMFSLEELFKDINNVKLSIVHPGISFTNITSHYPKYIFKLIKYPMKVIFLKQKKASLSIIEGVYVDCDYHYWIGPKFFNIWGFPSLKKITTCNEQESKTIHNISQDIYSKCE